MSVKSGYQGNFLPNVEAVIANAGTESSVIECNGFVPVGLILPAAFTGTALTFLVADAADGTFTPLYNASNAAVAMTVAQGRAYQLDPSLFQGVAFMKIKSGSSEAAERTLSLQLKGF